jgi:Transcriptional Coactivator p15 (PC4)
MADDIRIATISIGREECRVTLAEYRGHKLISLWRWYPDSDSGGEMRPGKRGVTVPIARLPELAAAVNEACERAKRDGLLPARGALNDGA